MCTKTINPNNHSAIFEPEYLLSMGCGKNRFTIVSFRTGASAIVSLISYLLTAIIKSLSYLPQAIATWLTAKLSLTSASYRTESGSHRNKKSLLRQHDGLSCVN